jgi:hypothetical protein
MILKLRPAISVAVAVLIALFVAESVSAQQTRAVTRYRTVCAQVAITSHRPSDGVGVGHVRHERRCSRVRETVYVDVPRVHIERGQQGPTDEALRNAPSAGLSGAPSSSAPDTRGRPGGGGGGIRRLLTPW